MSREPASRSRLLWKTCTEFTEIAAIHLWKSPGKPPNRLHDVKQIRSTGATPLPAGGFAWPEVAPHRAGAPPTRGPCSSSMPTILGNHDPARIGHFLPRP